MGELEKKSQEKYGDDITNKAIQAASDARKIVQAVSQIKEIQSRAEKIHKEEYMENHEVEEDFDEVWEKEYNKSDKFNEYLVNGALLTCTQATVEPFIIPGDAPIELHRDPDETEFDFKYGFGRKQTCLNVEENDLYLDKMPYATVKDTVRDVNIIPFRCNCAQEITGFSEIEYIRDHLEDCKENGVCKYLMWLNEEWDNMALSNTENTAIPPSYLSISDVEWVRAEDGTLQKNVCNSEGITRTSVLLCRRGGLIVPLTSGQEIKKYGTGTIYALACATSGGNPGELEWEQMKANAEYIYNYFDSKGWTAEAICGLLGNIFKESKMNPGIWQKWNNIEYGYGLVQCSPAREYIEVYAGLSKESVNVLAQNDPLKLMNSELQYFEDSLNNRWLPGNAQKQYNKLPLSSGISGYMTYEEYSKSAYKIRDMTLIFQACYERSGDNAEQLQERIAAAELWYDYFIGGNHDISRDDFPS